MSIVILYKEASLLNLNLIISQNMINKNFLKYGIFTKHPKNLNHKNFMIVKANINKALQMKIKLINKT